MSLFWPCIAGQQHSAEVGLPLSACLPCTAWAALTSGQARCGPHAAAPAARCARPQCPARHERLIRQPRSPFRTERQAANKCASLGSQAATHLSVCKDRRPAVRVAKAPDAPPGLGGAFHVRCQLSTRSGLCYICPLDRHRGLGPILPRTGTHGYCCRTMHGTKQVCGCMQAVPH